MDQFTINLIFCGVVLLIILFIILFVSVTKNKHKKNKETEVANNTEKVETTKIKNTEIKEKKSNSNEEDNVDEDLKEKVTIANFYHISQNKDEKSARYKEWRVRKQGSDKTIQYFLTQKEAIDFSENLALNNEGNVVVHKRTGKIRKHK